MPALISGIMQTLKKATYDLWLIPYPQAILKICPLHRLDYRSCHKPKIRCPLNFQCMPPLNLQLTVTYIMLKNIVVLYFYYFTCSRFLFPVNAILQERKDYLNMLSSSQFNHTVSTADIPLVLVSLFGLQWSYFARNFKFISQIYYGTKAKIY